MDEKKRKWITTVVFLAGLALMGLGIARGEVAVVLTKATTICLQCIGIG